MERRKEDRTRREKRIPKGKRKVCKSNPAALKREREHEKTIGSLSLLMTEAGKFHFHAERGRG